MIPKEQLTTEQLRGWISLDETAAEAFSLHSLSAFGTRNNIAVLAFRPLIEELIEAREAIRLMKSTFEELEEDIDAFENDGGHAHILNAGNCARRGLYFARQWDKEAAKGGER